ncbi:gliding motility protein GldB-related protein [Dyadobacter tibetensis]|uniref:gliding motility protein GldB-related protein n=1 Tax=Dyadobacter tibetensis TaxID=1211851 RepID=UPI0004701AD3|nr:hypothetical protein [Dyadobacter tibetensis]
MNKFQYFIICTLVGLITSCGSQQQDKGVKKTSLEIEVEDLDHILMSATSVKDVENILENHPEMIRYYFSDFEGDKPALSGQLFQITQNPDFQAFSLQVDSIIGNRKNEILEPLAQAFGAIHNQFPSFKSPRVIFIKTGFLGNDLYVSDSLVVIGLDYFGGPQATFRPNVFDYQLRRYHKENIVPAILYYIAESYNKQNPREQSLLDDMIGIGKSFEFVKQIMPSCPDSIIIGYSADNLRRAYNSQQDIWAFMINNKLLYEKNTLVKEKYIGERPIVAEMGPEIPGGIGRWIGWRIVNKYVSEHPEITLSELMAQSDANKILQEARYKGEKDEEE